jgi:hypothetical protein
MKHMALAIAGLIVLNCAVYAQETKSHKNHMDSAKVQQAMEVTADVYVCPMHKDVKSDMPGKCPKCKMDLVKKETAMLAAIKSMYTCPMHAEVKSDRQGKCPKCNMTLILEKKSK